MSMQPYPTTAILDNFNRSNTGPPPSANWSTPSSIGGLEVISNECAGDTAGNNLSYWNVATFGDSECYGLIVTKPASGGSITFNLRLKDTGSITTLDGYLVGLLVQAGTDIIRIQRIDNAAATTLGADINLEVDAGDQLMIRMVGSAIEVWHHDGASWSLIGERTDTTYAAAGNIGALITGTTARIDNFGGGTYTISGSTNATLGALTSTGEGDLLIEGSLNATLGALTSTGEGDLPITGSVNATLGTLTSTGEGDLPITGSVNATLGALTSSSEGDLLITGSVNATLGAVTLSAQSEVEIKGSTNATLGALTSSSEGDLPIRGSANITLGTLTLDADGTGNVVTIGQLNATLGTLTSNAEGDLRIAGAVNKTLGALTLGATGATIMPQGQASASFEAVPPTVEFVSIAPYFEFDAIPIITRFSVED